MVDALLFGFVRLELMATQSAYNVFIEDRGLSLLELALILPVIIILISGILEYGWALREIQSASFSAREGSRLAASYSHAGNMSCDNGPTPPSPISCESFNGNYEIRTGDSVIVAANKATCASLQNSRLDLADWQVKTEIRKICEDRSLFYLANVQIDQSPGANSCLLCWRRIISVPTSNYHSESSFALEGRCNSSVPDPAC